MNAWAIYWLTRLEPLGKAVDRVSGTLLVLSICIAFGAGCYALHTETWPKRAIKPFFLFLSLSGLFSFAKVFIPTNRDVAIIIAGQWALNSEEMAKLPDNVVATLNAVLDKAKAELGK